MTTLRLLILTLLLPSAIAPKLTATHAFTNDSVQSKADTWQDSSPHKIRFVTCCIAHRILVQPRKANCDAVLAEVTVFAHRTTTRVVEPRSIACQSNTIGLSANYTG